MLRCALHAAQHACTMFIGPRLHYGLLTLYVMGAQVSAGALHTCVVARNWSVVCFGSNAYRQASPPRGAGFVAVSAGLTFTCALRRM